MMLPTWELGGHHSRQCHVPPHFVPAYGVDITNGHPGSTNTDHGLATSSETISNTETLGAFSLPLPCSSGQIFKLDMSCEEVSIAKFLAQECTSLIPTSLSLSCWNWFPAGVHSTRGQ
jgi:hypothetical protein